MCLAFQIAKDEQKTAQTQQKTAALKQSAAAFGEMALVVQKIDKNVHTRADFDRFQTLYATVLASATDAEKKTALPGIANVMRKLGLKVPGG